MPPEAAREVCPYRAILGEVGQGVYFGAADPDLEVEVGAGGVAGAAQGADGFALGHVLALGHIDVGEVGVEGLGAVVVLDNHVVAVGIGIPSDEDHLTGGGGDDAGAVVSPAVDVDTGVVAAVVGSYIVVPGPNVAGGGGRRRRGNGRRLGG